MTRFLDVIDVTGTRRPGALRKAWCELTGGHSNDVLRAKAGEQTTGFALHCTRCGKRTRWYDADDRARSLLAARRDEVTG